MRGLTLKQFALTATALAFLGVVIFWQQPAQAGGPVLVGGTLGTAGVPFTWSTAAPVSYHTDRGILGSLSNDTANTVVRQAFEVWQDIPTAAISFSRSGDLGMDVNGSNHQTFFNSLQNCQQASSFTNAIVYDSDGEITKAILGEGQETMVIGFAGSVCISSANRITRGRAVLNGKFQDVAGNPSDLSPNQFKQVFAHEFGHLIGLDHSQINNEVADQASTDRTADDLFGLPLMFPALLSGSPARVDNGFPALAPDDEAWVSFLYKETADNPPTQIPFANQFGLIEGRVFFSDGVTPMQGGNLIARLDSNRRRFAYSSTSGFLFTGNPGQTATATYLQCSPTSKCPPSGFLGDNSAGSSFGSRDTSLIGFYQIPVKAGNYTVEVEAIDPEWIEGSSVGPLGDSDGAGEQFPLPGPPEFWNDTESNTDDPAAFSLVPASVGTASSGIDIILNGTPPRFDLFESARVPWREPATAWRRERRPPAFLVTA